MGAHNPYQRDVNADDFTTRLKRRDPEDVAAWSILLAYVRFQVTHELRSRPTNQDRVTQIEEFTSDVLFRIQASLDQFQRRGPFSAWVDALLRHEIADPDLKHTLQALTRFLVASHQLSAPDREALRALIQRIASPERELLQAATNGQLFLTNRQRYLWYHARRQLIDDPQFHQLLGALANRECRQAATLKRSYTAWKHQCSLSSLQARDVEDEYYELALIDPAALPLDLLIEQENTFDILACLERLRQAAPKQAEALCRQALYQESDVQIALKMDHAHPATVRQWIKRGRESLWKCLSSRLQDER